MRKSVPIPALLWATPELPTRQGVRGLTGCSAPSEPLDNPALDVAIELGNELAKPVVAFLPVPFYPHAYLLHYRFLASGVPEIAKGLAQRNAGFVLRAYPDHMPSKVLRAGPASDRDWRRDLRELHIR